LRSEHNLVLQVLDVIIKLGSPLVMGIVNELSHVNTGFQDIQIKSESLFQFHQALLLETRETTIVHELDKVSKFCIVLTN
jgi:hypothetical protein